MEIRTERVQDVTILHAIGRLDSISAPTLEVGLIKVVANEKAVVLDMADMNFVSSAGLRVLLVAAKKCKASGHRLALCGLAPEVRLVFDISGFMALFSIYPGRTEAVAALS